MGEYSPPGLVNTTQFRHAFKKFSVRVSEEQAHALFIKYGHDSQVRSPRPGFYRHRKNQVLMTVRFFFACLIAMGGAGHVVPWKGSMHPLCLVHTLTPRPPGTCRACSPSTCLPPSC